jgi:hypothetical protein
LADHNQVLVARTPGGKYALVTCAKSAELAVIDLAQKREVKRVKLAREDALAIVPQG